MKEMLLKKDKDHMFLAIESDKEGLYNIKFYEYYKEIGYKLLSIDKEYYSEETLKIMFEL